MDVREGGSQIVESWTCAVVGWVDGRAEGGSQIVGSWTGAVVHGSMDGRGGGETEPQTAVNKAPSVREHACLEGGESVGQEHQAAGAILQEHRIVFRVAGITKTHRAPHSSFIYASWRTSAEWKWVLAGVNKG